MDEQIALEAGYALSLKHDGTAPSKPDRTYAPRVLSLLGTLGKLNFGEWVMGPKPDPKSASWWGAVARCRLQGKDLSSPEGRTVYLDLYNHHAKRVPKDVAFSVTLEDGRGLVVGLCREDIRYTDVRTRTSVYDGIPWTEQNFKFQLQADACNRDQLKLPPEKVILQVAAAMKFLVDVGITDCRHVLLGEDDVYRCDMKPYLIGMYGTVPCAMSMDYRYGAEMNVWFHTLSPMGLAQDNFGHIRVGISGELVESELDLAALFKRK